MSAGLAVSVQVRLVRHAHDLKIDPHLVLARYAAERLLYRLSRSPYANRFVLKGALMLLVWLGETIRPTRDADLLGFGDINVGTLREIFAELCAMEVEPDGLNFDESSLRVAPIRVEDAYGGQRATSDIPLALTREFAKTEGKAAQWAGFVRRLPGTTASTDFGAVIAAAAALAGPVLIATGRKEPFSKNWRPGGPWR